MPTRAGSGKWMAGLLAQLDGVPAEANELVREMLGREPTASEYVAAHRAARLLADRGQVRANLEHVPGNPRRVLVLVKVSRWVTGSDGATGTDAEAPPVGSRRWLDAAWAAFGQDYRYAEQMCMAALKLLSEAERAALGAWRVGDEDGATAAEVRHPLGVRDVGGPVL